LLIAEQDSLLDDLDDEETKLMKQAVLQELKDQLEVFNAIVLSLSGFKPSTLSEAQNHFNALKREIERLKAHLPIYARRLDLIFTIASNRVTIIKADTGSGKSTQLVQYLVDAGLADRGSFA
jgi:HrpA-like RNA helicase